MTITIRQTAYAIQRLARNAVRLAKRDGTIYDVILTRYGPSCDCADFIFRRDGLDRRGCKHVQALMAEGQLK